MGMRLLGHAFCDQLRGHEHEKKVRAYGGPAGDSSELRRPSGVMGLTLGVGGWGYGAHPGWTCRFRFKRLCTLALRPTATIGHCVVRIGCVVTSVGENRTRSCLASGGPELRSKEGIPTSGCPRPGNFLRQQAPRVRNCFPPPG